MLTSLQIERQQKYPSGKIGSNAEKLYHQKDPSGKFISYAEELTVGLGKGNRALSYKPRAGPGVERIGRTPPPLAQSVETWPIEVRLVCRELRPVSLEERILVTERVGCGRHATHYFGLNFS